MYEVLSVQGRALTTPKHPGPSPLRQFLQIFSPSSSPTLFDHIAPSPEVAVRALTPRKPRAAKPKLAAASKSLIPIFEEQYRELRPRAPIPPLDIRFRRFTSLNTTIRLREGRLHVRLSDLLEHAPESVHHAIAHILLAKLYKKPIAPTHADRYRRHVSLRGRLPPGRAHPPDPRPQAHLHHPTATTTTSTKSSNPSTPASSTASSAAPPSPGPPTHARRMLGHYDAAHNTIVVSRVFDRPDTPRCAIEYLLYHEMLHLKHPVRVKAGRRCVHSREFQAEERLFPELEEAKAYLKRL